VINYDYPSGLECYTHRTGRTGRMGRSGTAMTFVTDRELKGLKSLFNTNHIDPVWHGTIPSPQAVSKQNRRRDDRKYAKKRSRPAPQSRRLSNNGNGPMRGERWNRRGDLGETRTPIS
jgi:superfamily II DNA/RNA helicase